MLARRSWRRAQALLDRPPRRLGSKKWTKRCHLGARPTNCRKVSIGSPSSQAGDEGLPRRPGTRCSPPRWGGDYGVRWRRYPPVRSFYGGCPPVVNPRRLHLEHRGVPSPRPVKPSEYGSVVTAFHGAPPPPGRGPRRHQANRAQRLGHRVRSPRCQVASGGVRHQFYNTSPFDFARLVADPQDLFGANIGACMARFSPACGTSSSMGSIRR